MRGEPNFLSILDSAKRIANITAGHEAASRIDPSKLESDIEKRLVELVCSPTPDRRNDRRARLQARPGDLCRDRAGAGTFFDEVMVMVEDEGVRRNRMALLRTIGNAVMKLADVTKIVVDRREYRP